jgi:hypothetical protein
VLKIVNSMTISLTITEEGHLAEDNTLVMVMEVVAACGRLLRASAVQ